METEVKNETLYSLEQLLQATLEGTGIQQIVATEHRYLRDLKVNVQNALNFSTLSKKESYLLALAVCINEKNKPLAEAFSSLALAEGASAAEIADTYACVSLLNANNVFYRFRHFTQKEFYQNAPAGIKMSMMMNPALGKAFFELMSLAVSALNGCEMCVNAHEASLLALNTSEQRIFDSIKLTAIIRSLTSINH